MTNGTIITEFILLGFSVPQWSRRPLSLFFVLLYGFIICGNVLIIILVKIESSLQTPMYFFIANFSFLEICYTTVSVPRMIRDLIIDNKSISIISCILQFYFIMVCGGNEHCLLGVLSYDRFIAICYPLRYSMIMKQTFCIQMICGAWLISFVAPASTTISLFRTKYCDINMDHFFCDISPLLQISCSDNLETEEVFYTLATVIILGCLLMICVSYSFILYSVLQMLHIRTDQGWQQTLSTCVSHFTVVTIYYSSCIFMYVGPNSHKNFQTNKLVSLGNVLVAPVLNPIIYTFRNKAMKNAIRKRIKF